MLLCDFCTGVTVQRGKVASALTLENMEITFRKLAKDCCSGREGRETVSNRNGLARVKTRRCANAAVQSAGQACQALLRQRTEVSTREGAASMSVFAHLHQQISAGSCAEDGVFSIQYARVSSLSYIRDL